MSSMVRVSLGLLAVTGGAIAIACAADGTEELSPSASDEAVSDGGMAITDASADSDVDIDAPAPIDAGPCSASAICAVSVPIDTQVNIMSIRGSSAQDVWAVGTNRTVLHYDGQQWEKDPIGDDATTPFTLRAVFSDRPDRAWVSDGSTVRHTTGWKGVGKTEWSPLSLQGGAAMNAGGIDGKDGDVFIARMGAGTGSLVRVAQLADGGLDAPRFLGSSTIRTGFEAIAITRADEIWASTAMDPSLRFLGALVRVSLITPDAGAPAWTFEEYDSRMKSRIFGIWGNDDAIWLVGEGGALRRKARDAMSLKAFERVESPASTTLRGVFGFATDDVWAVGDESTVLHWDGSAWTKLATPFDALPDKPRLISVWGSAKDDVWIGGNGVMLHFEGSAP